jgi:hypothetical protein
MEARHALDELRRERPQKPGPTRDADDFVRTTCARAIMLACGGAIVVRTIRGVLALCTPLRAALLFPVFPVFGAAQALAWTWVERRFP